MRGNLTLSLNDVEEAIEYYLDLVVSLKAIKRKEETEHNWQFDSMEISDKENYEFTFRVVGKR